MSRLSWVSWGLVAGALACGALAALSVIEVVSGVVLGALCLVFAIPAFIFARLGKGHERDARRVQELETRGRRVTGRVVDALPYTSATGGAVFRADGAQLVLQVDLDRGAAGKERVTVHLVENSELARARIGTDVTVLEHPEDPALRALEGYLPNGARRRS